MDPNNPEGRVAQHFNLSAAAYADDYSRERSPFTYFFERRQAVVMRFLQSLDGGSILDVGCGPGIYAKPCVERGFRYYGLDISDQMINEGRRRFSDLESVEFAVGNARQLPFPSSSVDGLLCLGTLEYISQEDQAVCLREMARVVRPGGIMIFSFLNASNPYWLWVDYGFPAVRFSRRNIKALLKNSKWVSFRDCSVEALPSRKFRLGERLKLLRALGLSVVGKAYFSLSVLPPPLHVRFVHQSVWASSKLEYLLQKPVFGWLGMAFVIAAQKSGSAVKEDERRIGRNAPFSSPKCSK